MNECRHVIIYKMSQDKQNINIPHVGTVLNMVERAYKPDPIIIESIGNSRLKTCIYFKYKCLLIFILGVLGLAQLFYILLSKIVANEKVLNLLGEILKKQTDIETEDEWG